MSIIASTGSSGNVVEGNLVGTNADGTSALGNSGTGIVAGLGTSRIADNVVSGNGEAGVDAGGGPMRIEGNHIGTNAAGDAIIANDGTGLQTFDLHSTSVIGGPADTQRNVVSGNAGHGMEVAGVGVQVLNNFVGSDASGTRDFGNVDDGIIISTSSDVVVGNASDGNLVFGNGGAGVRVQGQRTIVRGNRIEANGGDGVRGACCYNESTTDGNVVSGNGGWGIDLPALGTTTHFVRSNQITANVDGGANIGVRALVEDNEISGNDGAGLRIHAASDSAVNRNAISGNAGDGVTIASGMRNALSANSITGNSDLGIDLVDNGVTLNDATDADSGVNALQNFPVVTLARGLTVEGTLRSRPSATYTIELFWNATCDVPSDHGEGSRLVGSTSVTTNAAGDAGFAATLAAPLEPGVVTSTATDALGNTSELSRCKSVDVVEATIVIRKATLPSGDATEFAFSGALDARLSDGEIASSVVGPGEHTVAETELAGWDVSAIRCDDSDSSGNAATRTATFRVGAGETVECVFENTKQATITIRKETLPDGSSEAFDFSGEIEARVADGQTASKPVPPGEYRVVETAEPGSGPDRDPLRRLRKYWRPCRARGHLPRSRRRRRHVRLREHAARDDRRREGAGPDGVVPVLGRCRRDDPRRRPDHRREPSAGYIHLDRVRPAPALRAALDPVQRRGFDRRSRSPEGDVRPRPRRNGRLSLHQRGAGLSRVREPDLAVAAQPQADPRHADRRGRPLDRDPRRRPRRADRGPRRRRHGAGRGALDAAERGPAPGRAERTPRRPGIPGRVPPPGRPRPHLHELDPPRRRPARPGVGRGRGRLWAAVFQLVRRLRFRPRSDLPWSSRRMRPPRPRS